MEKESIFSQWWGHNWRGPWRKWMTQFLKIKNQTSPTVREMKPSLLKASRTMGLKAWKSSGGGGKKWTCHCVMEVLPHLRSIGKSQCLRYTSIISFLRAWRTGEYLFATSRTLVFYSFYCSMIWNVNFLMVIFREWGFVFRINDF